MVYEMYGNDQDAEGFEGTNSVLLRKREERSTEL